MSKLTKYRIAAKNRLREKQLKHIVYAYIPKEHPDELRILDWRPLEFKTDEEFEDYLKLAAPAAEMIYAVHATW